MGTTPARVDGTSRRSFLRVGASALGLMGLAPVLSACDLPFVGGGGETPEMPVDGPEEALQRLVEGNQRFAAGASKPINESADRRAKVVQRQRPFAMVFSCVDSRVPPELIFDRGLGDLFVIRTAGQVVDHAVMGSLEYGAYELEVPLLMVLGHKKCGAVKATMEAVEAGAHAEGSIDFLIDQIRPAVAGEAAADGHAADPHATEARGGDAHGSEAGDGIVVAAGTDAGDHGTTADHGSTADRGSTRSTTAADGTTEIQVDDPDEAAALAEELAAGDDPAAEGAAAAEEPDELTDAIKRNVALTVKKVSASPIIAERVKKDRLLIVGGIYDLQTGLVELTENVPDQFKPQAPAPAEGEAAG